jgi:arginase family enzyme
MSEKIKIFGTALDPLDGPERVEIKRAYTMALSSGIKIEPNYLDPYEGICSANPDLFEAACEKAGKVPIETWLTPKPGPTDLLKVTGDNYKAFLESNGCYHYSKTAGNFLDAILPNPFVLLGVDHSQTGGIVRRLSGKYGPDQISLIVIDAHTDMFDFDLLYTIQGELLRKQGLGDRLPKTLYSNTFYGCGNFLKSLLAEGAVLPQNLYLLGVTDYPDQTISLAKDAEMMQYVDTYDSFGRNGVKIIPKSEIESSIENVSKVLDTLSTPYVYLSIDMDAGAFLTTFAVRFLNTIGMAEDCFYRLVKTVKDSVAGKKARIIGMDLMELDIHYAGYVIQGKRDRSYEIAGNLIRMVTGRV